MKEYCSSIDKVYFKSAFGFCFVALYNQSVYVQIRFFGFTSGIRMSVVLFTAGVSSQLSPVVIIVAHTNWFDWIVRAALFLQRIENVLCRWIIIKFATILCVILLCVLSSSFGPSSGPQHCGSDLPPFLMQSRLGFQSILDQKRW